MRRTFLRIETSISGSVLKFEFRPKNLRSVPNYKRSYQKNQMNISSDFIL